MDPARLGGLALTPPRLTRKDIFARRGVGVVHGEIVAPSGRPDCCGKVQKPASAARAPDELNDFGAHEKPSHNAIAIRPAKASEIR
jgi:hypothetical protein